MRTVFRQCQPLEELASPRQGPLTSDNSRFVRSWWEVARTRTGTGCTTRQEARASRARWFPYNKGGEFRKFWGNQEHVVNWEDDGREIIELATRLYRSPTRTVKNMGYYFRPTVSWSNVSSGAPAFRLYPSGFIAAGSTGDGVYPDSERLALQLLSVLTSTTVRNLLAATSPTLTFNVGTLAKLPVVDARSAGLESSAASLVATSRMDWDSSETSWNFAQNRLIVLAG